jgi:predicted DNA-binding protein with PD1-like motif
MLRVLTACIGFFILSACQTKNMKQEIISTYAFRLKPGEDVKEGIERTVKEKNIKAGWVAACVGSLTDYSIRFANQPGSEKGIGHFEIVSLVGTVSINGSHLHISISDSSGKTLGGHLMPGCKVFTTAEIILGSTDKYEFFREKDGSTAWEELKVTEKISSPDRRGME